MYFLSNIISSGKVIGGSIARGKAINEHKRSLEIVRTFRFLSCMLFYNL